MPLTKLFQRRNSSQKDRKKSLTSAELSASDSIAEASSENKQELTEVNSDTNLRSSASLEDAVMSKRSDIPPESDDLIAEVCESNEQSEINRRCSVPETSSIIEQVRHKSRSLSLKESGTKLIVQRTRRRKCESESAAFSSTDDEGFEDKIIQLRERDLEKVIGQCVDRLIRESILTAVKSVKVDNLYEDVIKSLSRSASESSDSSGGPETVQQKLHTDSVTEYADLKMVHTFEEEMLESEELDETENCQKDHQTSPELSNQLQSDIKNEYKEKDCAIIEEAVASDSVFTEKMSDTRESVKQYQSDNSTIPDVPVETDIKDSVKSFERRESSTEQQNEQSLTEVQVSDSNKQEKSVETNQISTEDKELPSSIACDQGNEAKESSIPSQVINETEQNESVKETVDSSMQEKAHAPKIDNVKEIRELRDEVETDQIKNVKETIDFSSQEKAPVPKIDSMEETKESRDEVVETEDCKIEVEEVKDTSVDGYHADIEESISLHSMASETSFENLIDSKVYLRTTSDDTLASTDEVSLGGNVDATPNEDNDEELLDNKKAVKTLGVESDLMAMSGDDFSYLLTTGESTTEEPSTPAADLGENLPEQKPAEEEKKVNWKVGYLHVKLPHKSRHKKLKVWKKRCVAIQPDEFTGDDSDPCLVMSVYSGDSSAAKKHSASFWKSVSCQRAVVYRSSSRTHPYAFTLSEDKKALIHLAADSEAISQEWMAAIRAILWPPSPVVQLEKMLNGREFEISIIDNDFSYHAGLLGMYGYLTITPKKLILVHPQQGYVIQEWYLNTIDKFQLMQQTRIEDINKILSMTTCSDSSTGKGTLLIFCKEAVALLQAVASTIHQILSHHSKQEGGKYQKELEEIGEWLVADSAATEDYYKVPPRQVKSLLDIPNFIFNKPLTPVATEAGTSGESQKSTLEVPKANPTRASQDSGISSETVADDFLNCSASSFVVGGGPFPGKSSDSELSDTYTPPRSPEVKSRREAELSEAKVDE